MVSGATNKCYECNKNGHYVRECIDNTLNEFELIPDNKTKNEDKLEMILQEWYSVKLKKSKYEKKYAQYRDKIEKWMEEKQIDELITDKYKVRKSVVPTDRILKDHIPSDIWNKYKTTKDIIYLYLEQLNSLI